jgi:hypothetical protein
VSIISWPPYKKQPKLCRAGNQNTHKPHHGKDALQPNGPSGALLTTIKPTCKSLYTDANLATRAMPPSNADVADDIGSISTKKSGKSSLKTKTKSCYTRVHFAALPSVKCHNDAELFNAFSFAQYGALISDTWILLYNQSTVDIFCNPALLSDIHEVDVPLTVHCTGGPRVVTQMGTLCNYGLVWFYPDGIANIISMSNAE